MHHNRQLFVFEEDARAGQRRWKCVDPPLRVRVRGGVQLGDRRASRLSAEEAAAETLRERASTAQHASCEPEATENGLEVFGANGGLLKTPCV